MHRHVAVVPITQQHPFGGSVAEFAFALASQIQNFLSISLKFVSAVVIECEADGCVREKLG